MTTVEVAPRRAGTRIKLRRPPQYEPPFDDERTPEPPPIADQLALTWPTPAPGGNGHRPEDPGTNGTAEGQDDDLRDSTERDETSPAGTSHQVNRAARDRPRGERGTQSGVDMAPRSARTTATTVVDTPAAALSTSKAHPAVPAGASSDARLAVRRFVSACVEVLNGHRPAAHLRRLALPAEAARVVAQAVAGAHRVAELRRADPRRPLPRARRRPAPVAVLRVHLCGPSPGAIEASVVLVTGERTWALALRLEMHHETWVATALRLV